jgi:hypothetical protein
MIYTQVVMKGSGAVSPETVVWVLSSAMLLNLELGGNLQHYRDNLNVITIHCDACAKQL